MHAVLIDVRSAHGRKCPGSHMQCDERLRDPARAQLREDCRVEMQPRRRGSDRTERARIHCLIALLVRILRSAIDVRRQRHFTVRLKELEHIAGELQDK